MSIWRDWLPVDLPARVNEQEPGRFAACIRALKQQWEADACKSSADRSQATLPWISLFKSITTTWHKPEVTEEDANLAAELLLDIVLQSKYCLASRMRWADQLRKLLRALRKTLTLTIDWRPLYQLIHECSKECLHIFSGPQMFVGQLRTYVLLVHRCRRFFPASADQEIWEECWPALPHVFIPQSFEALGWLVLLLPTHRLQRPECDAGAWNERLKALLGLWSACSPSSWWSSQCLGLLARMAKHDTQGVLRWEEHAGVLFTHMLSCFHVPVGTATAAPPISRHSGASLRLLFEADLYPRTEAAAKLIMYMLRPRGSPSTPNGLASGGSAGAGEEAGDEAAEGALGRLVQLARLLEQYYHPSNNGMWDTDLAGFLKALVKYWGKRLVAERSPGDPLATQRAPAEGRAQLTNSMNQQLADVVIQLASRAQYAKDRTLRSVACNALASAAFVAPSKVLPLVVQRFQEALVSLSAAHQLVSALHTLSHCLRPLLLAGGPRLPTGTLDSEVAVPELIAMSMHAVLPGIDANDGPKCLTVFNFLSILLSSLPQLPEDAVTPGLVPLDSEEWVDELLQRLCAVLTHLDSPETRSEGSATAQGGRRSSFLLDKSSMYRPMLGLLFARLPPRAKLHATKRVAKFVTDSSLPSVGKEVGLLARAAAEATPDEAVKLLLQPLLQQLDADMGEGAQTVSRAQEARMKWQMHIIMDLSGSLASRLPSVKPQLLSVIRKGFASTSQEVQVYTGFLVSHVLTAASYFAPSHPDMFAPSQRVLEHSQQRPLDVDLWCEFRWRDGKPPTSEPAWDLPSPAQTAMVQEVMTEHLEAAAGKLLEASATGSVPAKQQLMGLLNGMLYTIIGQGSTLGGDWQQAPGPWAVVGQIGPVLGDAALRSKVSKALLAAVQLTSDPEALSIIVRAMGELLVPGTGEYEDANIVRMGDYREAARVVKEPSIAGIVGHEGQEGLLWRGRWPRWILMERVSIHAMWRASQAAFRPWQGPGCLVLEPPAIDATQKDMVAALAAMSLQNYSQVRTMAQATLATVLKRHPGLAPGVLPLYLGVVSGLEGREPKAAWEDSEAALQLVVDAAVPAMGRSSGQQQDISPAEAGAGTARLEGALQALTGMALYRVVSRSPAALAGLMAAIMASSSGANVSPKAHDIISRLFVQLMMKYIPPPELRYLQAEHSRLPEPLAAVAQQLQHLAHADSASPGAPARLHWRYSLMAGILQVMLLPPASRENAAATVQQALQATVSAQPGQHALGAALLSFLLPAPEKLEETAQSDAAVEAFRHGIERHANFGPQLLTQMAAGHVTAGNEGAGGMAGQIQRMMQQPWHAHMTDFLQHGQLLVGDVLSSFRPELSPKEGALNLLNIRLVKGMAVSAPQQVQAAIREPVEKLLRGNQVEDRTRTCAAIELLCGLLASGKVFDAQGAWHSWARQLLEAGLEAAPLDLAQAWAAGVAFALRNLSKCQHNACSLLLASVTKPLAPGAGSTPQLIRSCLIHACMSTLVEVGAIASGLESWTALHLRPFCSAQAREAGRQLQDLVLRELPEAMLQTSSPASAHAAECLALLVSPHLWHQQRHQELPHAVPLQNIWDQIQAAMQAGHALVVQTGRQSGQEAASTPAPSAQNGDVLMQDATLLDSKQDSQQPGAAGSEGGLQGRPDVRRLAFVLHFIVRGLSAADGLASAHLGPWLKLLLQQLFEIQEMASPELQSLALEARKAAVLVKYMPLPSQQLPAVAHTLSAAPTMQPWPARGSALAFMQYFWFRHSFLLGPEEVSTLQKAVQQLLRDSKLEVQELAAATLSGFLKGLPAPAEAALRDSCLADLQRLFPTGRATKATPEVREQQLAAVLAVKACVQSAPYDIPSWLAPLLVGLLRAAKAPQPLKTVVRKALADFRRTHEEAELAQMREQLTADQWDTLQEVASPATYIA